MNCQPFWDQMAMPDLTGETLRVRLALLSSDWASMPDGREFGK